jgi:hypothetical protein
MKNKIIMRKVNAEFLQKKKKKGENKGRKTGERKRNFLNLVSTYFLGSFFTHTIIFQQLLDTK